jgi:hypothetical protein
VNEETKSWPWFLSILCRGDAAEHKLFERPKLTGGGEEVLIEREGCDYLDQALSQQCRGA